LHSPLVVSFVVMCSILAGIAIGARLRSRLPEHHLSPESENVIKLGIGLIGTMSALVLGLLIASAQTTYDRKRNELNQITADGLLIDQLLAQYGPETKPIREHLRTSLQMMADMLWNEDEGTPRAFAPSSAGLETYRLLNSLSPGTDLQRALSVQISETTKHLSQLRLILFAQSDSSIPSPFVFILMCWLTLIFGSFSLFGPANATVLVFLVLCAASAAGAIFLILQLNDPFAGILQIPKATLLNALGPVT
jgi:hypothetical protein